MTGACLIALGGKRAFRCNVEGGASTYLFRRITKSHEPSMDRPTFATQLITVIKHHTHNKNLKFLVMGKSSNKTCKVDRRKSPKFIINYCSPFEQRPGPDRTTSMPPTNGRLDSPLSRIRWQSSPSWQLHYPKSENTIGRVTTDSQPPSGWETTNKMILYAASMVHERESTIIHAFAATMATSETDFRRRLAGRAGMQTASTATVTSHFDPSEPIAAYLLPDSIAEILVDVRDDPMSILANGLDVYVEHRFAMERSAPAPLCILQ